MGINQIIDNNENNFIIQIMRDKNIFQIGYDEYNQANI